MVASPRQDGRGDDHEGRGSRVKSSTPHFFKIIDGRSLRLGRIPIPTKFVREYGDDLSGSMVLKVPNGEIWNIGLLQNEDGLWLQKRWPKFVQRYSIRENYLVEFCHEGESIFQVVIFDIAASEIDYPAVCGQMHCPARARSTDAPRVALNTRNMMSYRHLEVVNFRSRYPYFWVHITEKYARKGSVAISTKFMTRYELTERSQMVKLQHGEKSWPVKMYYYSSRGRGGSFCKGWIKFSKKNNIKEGDVCVFELIKKNETVFKVTILRGGE